MHQDEFNALVRAIAETTEIATGFGLDFSPMRNEICPADIIYTFGAYGMPTRFSHWNFGTDRDTTAQKHSLMTGYSITFKLIKGFLNRLFKKKQWEGH
jgi:spore cortex formation protein SpoVR/YcgB (stage V sporulation)